MNFNKTKKIIAKEVEEYQLRLLFFNEIVEQANSLNEVSELLEKVLQTIQRILKSSASKLLLINEGKGEFYLQSSGDENQKNLEQIQINPDSGIIGWVACHGRPVVIKDAQIDNRFKPEIDTIPGIETKSVLAAPIMRGQNVIGVLELINKPGSHKFNEKDLAILTGFVDTEALVLLVSMMATAVNNIELCQSLKEVYTVDTLTGSSEAKDPFSLEHSRRVSEYALMMTDYLPLSAEDVKDIVLGARLHDLGKIGIPGSLLKKPGPLNCEEWYIMCQHSYRGAKIVSEIPYLTKTRDIILFHHERYDGTGYPKGLKGEEIPIGARIVAVADAFDTMTTKHSYRGAMTPDEAIAELIRFTGTQFCPLAVGALISGLDEFKTRSGNSDEKQTAKEKTQNEAEEILMANPLRSPAREEFERTKVVLSDPQVIFREGLHFMLLEDGNFEVTGETENNEDALMYIEDNPTNIAILNIDDDGLDGIEATKRIKLQSPSVSVILITDERNDEQLLAALKAGASAYLTKNVLPEYVLNIMRSVAQGKQPIIDTMLTPGIAVRVLNEFERLSPISEQNSNLLASLSQRESQLLNLLSRGKNVEDIISTMDSNEVAVKYDLGLILHKLIVNNQAQEIIEAVKLSLPAMNSRID